MELPRVIGLAGRKRSGKDTLAAQLGTLGYESVAFADPLRELAIRLNPIVTDHGQRYAEIVDRFGYDWAKENVPEIRRVLQFLGTEVVREIQPDYWVNRMRERICDNDGLYVVTDVRFENEAAVIRECGGLIVEVHRPSLGTSTDGHISEAGVSADWVVQNTGTREDLFYEFMREVDDL